MQSLSLLLGTAAILVSATSAQFVFFGGNRFGGASRPSGFGAPRQPSAPFRFSQPAPAPSFGRFQARPQATRSFAQPLFSGNVAAAAPVRPEPVASPAAAPAASEGPKGNYEWQGRNYLLTWRTGQNKFDWSSGVSYCKSQGMSLISLDSAEKAEHFLGLVVSDRAPYFWTGGSLSRDDKTVTWQNGQSQGVLKGEHPWSYTGRTGPQPDGGERCVAVLNNTYRDGAKFHDVACHHTKPVICEA